MIGAGNKELQMIELSKKRRWSMEPNKGGTVADANSGRRGKYWVVGS